MVSHFALAQRFIMLLLAGALFSGCNPLAKRCLIGTYHRQQTGTPVASEVQQLEITADKFILNVPLAGEIASDYTVEGEHIYVGGQPGQVVFSVDRLVIISNQGNVGMAGTYIKY